MEYLFKKEDLQNLIDTAADSNIIAISVDYIYDEVNSVFNAEIVAKAFIGNAPPNTLELSAMSVPVKGCPNPPGCASIF